MSKKKKKIRTLSSHIGNNPIKLKNNNNRASMVTVLKNPPANVGEMVLISGPGRSHMPRSN